MADGYVSPITGLPVGQKASGWYIHNSYNLTDKIQLVARFDQFDPDRTIGKLRTEYTLGQIILLPIM